MHKMEQLKSRIEAVLFVTAKVLQVNDIAEILEEEPDKVEEALLELIMDYASREGALEIDDENGWRETSERKENGSGKYAFARGGSPARAVGGSR